MTTKLAHLNKESWLKTHICRLIQNIRGNLAWLSFHFKYSVTNIQLVCPQNILNLMLPSLLVCPHLIFDSSCLPDSVNRTKCSSLYQTQHWAVIEATGPCHVILHLVLSLNSFFLSPAMTTIYDLGQWLILHANVDYSLTLWWSHFNQADLIGFGKNAKDLWTLPAPPLVDFQPDFAPMRSAEQWGWKCQSSPFKPFWAKHGLCEHICCNLHAQW